jgi:hypothetical protein
MNYSHCLYSNQLHYLCLSSCNQPLKNVSITARVGSSKKFSANLNVIRFSPCKRLPKIFLGENLAPNQHSSQLRQYYSRLQGRRRVAYVCAVAQNVCCLETTARQSDSKRQWHCCQIAGTHSYCLWHWTWQCAGDSITVKLLNGRSDLVAASVVLLKARHEIELSIFDIPRNIICTHFTSPGNPAAPNQPTSRALPEGRPTIWKPRI